MLSTRKAQRKRVNFMLNVSLIEAFETYVPAGQRSDFLNEALEEQLTRLSREKASEATDWIQKKFKLKVTTQKILKDTDHGLE